MPPTKILLVGSGASYSTKDVENGYYNALINVGADVKLYLLDTRIALANNWINYFWKHTDKSKSKPTWSDVLYLASVEALEMALSFDVDWVLIIAGMYVHPGALILMRRAGLNVAALLTESPYLDKEQSSIAKLVHGCWTNERTSVPKLQETNKNIKYMRHAYFPGKHAPTKDSRVHDVSFVGVGFQERIDLLTAVDWTGINLNLWGDWKLLPSRHKLRQYLRGGLVTNEGAVDIYHSSKIGLNLYRTSKDYAKKPAYIEGAESLNPRAYELAACGVFQLSNYRAEVPEILDTSVAMFDGPKQLEEQIRYYLAHNEERVRMEKEAMELVRPHTFQARAYNVLQTLGTGTGASNGS